MAALVDGQYTLSSRTSTSAGKTIVHVKLTDSAYKALEEYQKIKDATSRRPTVAFDTNNGLIQVPIKKSSDNPDGLRSFRISLSNIQTDQNGRLDCIWQPHKSRPNLDTKGTMSHKVVVHATDDVFKQTMEKMTKAEVESKKNCAKEIKPSGGHISRKIKRVLKGEPSGRAPQKGASYSQHQNGVIQQHRSAAAPQPHKAHNIPHQKATNAPPHQRMGHSPQSTSNHGSSGPTLGANSVKRSPHQQTQTAIGRCSPNPAVFNLPYRDRIIHLLALRPYKKPELLARLQRDGVRDRDKNVLSTMLQQVAVFNRDNTFVLIKSLYNEIRPDFPGYTETDRQLLKRRRPLSESTGQSAGSSPAAISPTHSHSSTGSSPGGSQKRPTSTTDDEPAMQPRMKKPRISHERQREMRQVEASRTKPQVLQETVPNNHNSPKPVSPKTTTSLLPLHTTLGTPTSPTDSPAEVSTTTPDTLLQPKDEKDYLKAKNINVDKHVRNHSAKFPASSTSVTPNYLLEYKAIQTADDRQRYKLDFNSEYEEYRVMHDSIDKVTKRFRALEMSLRQEEEGSEDYENIKNKILNEYRTVRKDPKYVEHRRRCDYLHKKLGHIKKLILEYDQAQLMQS